MAYFRYRAVIHSLEDFISQNRDFFEACGGDGSEAPDHSRQSTMDANTTLESANTHSDWDSPIWLTRNMSDPGLSMTLGSPQSRGTRGIESDIEEIRSVQ